MKLRCVYTTMICALLLILMAIIAMRADQIGPVAPTIHIESIEAREGPDDVAADAEPEPTACNTNKLDSLIACEMSAIN